MQIYPIGNTRPSEDRTIISFDAMTHFSIKPDKRIAANTGSCAPFVCKCMIKLPLSGSFFRLRKDSFTCLFAAQINFEYFLA